MESVDKQIKEFFENRINENIDLPFPSNMDLFFWGDKKDINLYLHHILTFSALVRLKYGDFIYKKIIVINPNLEIEKNKFKPLIEQLQGQVSIEFINTPNLETSEIEAILNNNEQAFIIVFQAEKYISTPLST